MTRLSFVGALALGFASVAIAQPGDPLKGPEVKDNGIPGQKRSFGDGEKGRKAQGQRPLPLAVVNKALDVLRADSAGENKLSADQESKVKAAMDEHQAATRDYIEKNREELATLRAKVAPADRTRVDRALREFAGPAKGKGAKKDKGAEPAMAPMDGDMMDSADKSGGKSDEKADAEAAAKARERLVQILEGRPKTEDAQAKIWAALTDAQKPIAEKELAKLREQAQRPTPTPAATPAGGEKSKQDTLAEELKNKTADEIMNDPRVPERLRERLRNMTPEQREQAVKRMRERGFENLRAK